MSKRIRSMSDLLSVIESNELNQLRFVVGGNRRAFQRIQEYANSNTEGKITRRLLMSLSQAVISFYGISFAKILRLSIAEFWDKFQEAEDSRLRKIEYLRKQREIKS